MLSKYQINIAQRKAKLPEGADRKSILPGKTPAKKKAFDSYTSPSGQLERFVNCHSSYYVLVPLLRRGAIPSSEDLGEGL